MRLVALLFITLAACLTKAAANRPSSSWYHENCVCRQAEPGTNIKGRAFTSEEECMNACNVLCMYC